MKKLLSICAATMLLSSCSSDDALSNQGSEQKVRITVALPDAVSSRAGGSDSSLGGISNTDDEGVTFSVALYHGDKATAAFTGNKTVNPGENTVTFEPVLVVGETYRIVAYAGFDGSIDMESRGATVNVNNAINDETQDMYFCSTDIVAEPQMSATLKRPYGKLRIIAEDYAELNRQLDKTITGIAVAYKDGRQQTFNPESGLWEGDYAEANYTDAWTDEDAYANETGDARTILVDYIPTGVTGDDNVSFTVTVTFDDNTSFTRSFNEDIPVKRNYLTTLTGDFFTSTMDLKLNIEEAFEGEEEINYDEELAWILANGGTYTLQEDLSISEPLVIDGGASVVINLNGNKIIGEDANLVDCGLIEITGGSKLAIKGDGEISATRSYPVWVQDGVVTIEGGAYKGTYSSQAVYVSKGTAYIKGGTFEVDSKWYNADGSLNETGGFDPSTGNVRYLLNCLDTPYGNGEADIVVTGGIFHNFDPANNVAEGAGTDFVAEGYKSVKNGDNYVVVADVIDAVASTGEELSDALSSGKSVLLTEDVNIGTIDLTSVANDIVIDAGGNTITTSKNYGIETTAGKDVTIKNAEIKMTLAGTSNSYTAGFKIANGDYQGKTI
ncbi:MAG: hypothetical protein IJZ17_04320, partial [Muribaculaceae bacterium]|nr:hypothetical protein [Muribaculaceae bacterium]